MIQKGATYQILSTDPESKYTLIPKKSGFNMGTVLQSMFTHEYWLQNRHVPWEILNPQSSKYP